MDKKKDTEMHRVLLSLNGRRIAVADFRRYPRVVRERLLYMQI